MVIISMQYMEVKKNLSNMLEFYKNHHNIASIGEHLKAVILENRQPLVIQHHIYSGPD